MLLRLVFQEDQYCLYASKAPPLVLNPIGLPLSVDLLTTVVLLRAVYESIKIKMTTYSFLCFLCKVVEDLLEACLAY